MRWIVRPTKADPNTVEKVLQYRQLYDATPYAAVINKSTGQFYPEILWSDWIDVPTVLGSSLF